MLQYFILGLFTILNCRATESGSLSILENPHKKPRSEPIYHNGYDHKSNLVQTQDNKTKLALTTALKNNVSHELIDKAITTRNKFVRLEPSLKDKNFSISNKGNVLFEN